MSDDRSRQVLRLAVIALVGLVACALVYLLAVQTEIGQRVDTSALRGGDRTPLSAQVAANRMLRVVSIGGLVLGIAALGAVAAAGRRKRLILVPGAVIGGSLIAVELLKHVILTRPALLEAPEFIRNTYPSGHVTVAISVGLAAVIVAPIALRGAVALLAFLGSAGFGVLVVTAGWHLPSDALGAYAITLAIAAGVMGAVYAFFPDAFEHELEGARERADAARIAGRIELGAITAGLALFAGAIVFASLRYGPDIDWQRADAAFLGSAAVIVFAAGLTVAAMLRGLSTEGDRVGLAAQPATETEDPRRPTQ